MTRYEKARRWRERLDLSRKQLADLSGYSYESIVLYERGFSSRKTWSNRKAVLEEHPIDDTVFHRYRMVCAGVEQELKSGRSFTW